MYRAALFASRYFSIVFDAYEYETPIWTGVAPHGKVIAQRFCCSLCGFSLDSAILLKLGNDNLVDSFVNFLGGKQGKQLFRRGKLEP